MSRPLKWAIALYNCIVSDKKGRYSRGYLPHIDLPGLSQFVTWRLKDAVPDEVLQRWIDEFGSLADGERKTRLLSQIETYCDAGHGSCLLTSPRYARIVQESLFFKHGVDYELHAWSVMPNHVHVLLTPYDHVPLAKIVGSVKGFTSKRINRLLKQEGQLWQEDYFDRYIRDQEHFARVRSYIEWNAVKAKVRTDPTLHKWCSANPDSLKRLAIVAAAAGETPADLMRARGPRSE